MRISRRPRPRATAPRAVYAVTATEWEHGWELAIHGLGATQSKTLARAEHMVRDYIALDLDVPEDSFDVEIRANIEGQLLGTSQTAAVAELEQRMPRRRRRGVSGFISGAAHSHTRG